MKVIGFTGNYGIEDGVPKAYLMADSSILYTGRPFFVPDFAQRFVATPTIVVRMGRLGKCVAPKFAHRYWDAFTAGYTVCASQSDDIRLTGLDRAFDGAAIVGDWIPVADVPDAVHELVEFKVGDHVAAKCCLADMRHPLEELVADAGVERALSPGDHLTASIGGRQVLDVKVRL